MRQPCTKAELKIHGDGGRESGILVMNSESPIILSEKGLRTLTVSPGVGSIDWEKWTFSENPSLRRNALFSRRQRRSSFHLYLTAIYGHRGISV